MNFGAFAGGFSQGFNNGVSMAKTIRDVIKERKLQDLREQGMAEAERQRAQGVQDMIKEQGVTGQQATEAPTSGPIDSTTPKVETPQTAQQISAASPTASPDAASANTAAASMAPANPAMVSAASPTANPDPAGAATAAASMPPSVSTQAPASEPATTSTVQPTPAQTSQAQPVQASPQQAASPTQAVAGQGVPGATKPPKFFVNGIGYETREQAMAAANREAPSAMDLFMKNAAPQIAQQYLVNGDPATAKAWTDYAESQTGKRAIKDWAAAYSAPDFDTAVARFGKYYTDHINDGVDYTGHKMLTKEDGSQVAVVTLKDKATGKTTEMELTREKMIALGGANNPQKLFEMEQAKQREADKLKLEAQLKARERAAARADKRDEINLTQDRIDQREGQKARNKIDEIAFKHEMDAEFEQKYKKTTSPSERAALIQSDLVKNDPRFNRLSEDEQKDAIKKRMKMLDEVASDYEGGKSQAGTAAPKFSDKPMAFDKALPVYKNNKTGQRFHLKDGVMVPIADAPAASAAPAATTAAPASAQPAPAASAPATPARPQASGLPTQPSPAPAATPEPAPEKAPAQPIDATPEGLSKAKAALDAASSAYQQVMADYQFATSLKNRANVTPTQIAAIQAEMRKAEAAMAQAKEVYRLTNEGARKARADAAYSPAAALAESAKAGAAARLSRYGQ